MFIYFFIYCRCSCVFEEEEEVVAEHFSSSLLHMHMAKTHSHLVIRCQRWRFKLVTEGHLVRNCSEQTLCYSAPLPNKPAWGFLTCNCRVIISFYSDSVCADYREGGSSKGHPRGHREACQEFQSRPFDLWLLQHSACAAWLGRPAPPRLWLPILPSSLPPSTPTHPRFPALYIEERQKINEPHAVKEAQVWFRACKSQCFIHVMKKNNFIFLLIPVWAFA